MSRLIVIVATFVALLQGPAVFAADLSWTESVDLGMDFRYRHEMQDAEEDTAGTRHRQRIRARLSLSGEVDENVKLYLRLATGSSDYRKTIASGNETLDDGGANDNFWVDKAYAEWKASDANVFLLGKFDTPFYKPSKSQLIWDSDYTPEGLAYNYNRVGVGYTAFMNIAGLWLDENHAVNDTSDKGIVGGQIGGSWLIGEPTLVVSFGYYSFVNLKDGNTIDGGSGGGNTLYTGADTSEKYKYDYNLMEGSVELKSTVAEMPSSIYVNYVQNQDPSDENVGYIAGFKLGKVKAPGDWAFIYNYRKVEKDAVISVIADSDFSDSKTDIKGHTIAIVYGIFKNSDIALAYFDAERFVSTTAKKYQRAHVDFSFKF